MDTVQDIVNGDFSSWGDNRLGYILEDVRIALAHQIRAQGKEIQFRAMAGKKMALQAPESDFSHCARIAKLTNPGKGA